MLANQNLKDQETTYTSWRFLHQRVLGNRELQQSAGRCSACIKDAPGAMSNVSRGCKVQIGVGIPWAKAGGMGRVIVVGATDSDCDAFKHDAIQRHCVGRLLHGSKLDKGKLLLIVDVHVDDCVADSARVACTDYLQWPDGAHTAVPLTACMQCWTQANCSSLPTRTTEVAHGTWEPALLWQHMQHSHLWHSGQDDTIVGVYLCTFWRAATYAMLWLVLGDPACPMHESTHSTVAHL